MNIILENIDLKPALYLVGTPIGNLKDITLRAIQTLNAVDMIFCEDTRITGKLLKAYDIKTRMAVYTDHSDKAQRLKILKAIQEDKKAVALVSDAGLPLISDPGYKLVRDAISKDILLFSIPGPSATLTALQVSGLPSDSFTFGGFIPSKDLARKQHIQKFKSHAETLIFYETVPRLPKTLEVFQDILGDRQCIIARELTKKFEEILRGSPEELLNYLEEHNLKGEVVLLVEGEAEKEYSDEDLKLLLDKALSTMSVKEAASLVSLNTKMSKKKLYDMALDIKNS